MTTVLLGNEGGEKTLEYNSVKKFQIRKCDDMYSYLYMIITMQKWE